MMVELFHCLNSHINKVSQPTFERYFFRSSFFSLSQIIAEMIDRWMFGDLLTDEGEKRAKNITFLHR